MEFYKLSERFDLSKNNVRYKYKKFNYLYNGIGEFDGYPNYRSDTDIPDTYIVQTQAIDDLNNTELYTYNKRLLCTNVVKEGIDHKNETINEYDSVHKQLLTKTIYRTYNTDLGQYMERVENFQYDSDGYRDLIYYWSPLANGDITNDEYKTSFTYDSSRYHLLTGKTFKRDANNTIREEYTPSEDGKTIIWAKIYEKTGNSSEKLKKQTWYDYDLYGNVIEQRDYLDNWSDYISTKFSYMDNDSSRNGKFNGLYITRKWTDGVKDADGVYVAAKSGNSAGTIDEVYQYDWFGNLVQKQDGQGNVWRTTFDKLNRVTSEINPDNTIKTYTYTTNTTENSVIETDENGVEIKSYFDEFGNLICIQDVLSGQNLNHYTYDSIFRLKTEDNNNTSSYSRMVTYEYCSDNRIKQRKVCDRQGQILEQVDFTYDDAINNGLHNKVTKTIAGDSSAPSCTTVTYTNKLGQVEMQGRVHNNIELLDTFKYDYVGNMIEEKSARAYDEGWNNAYTKKYEYNYAGKPIKVTNIDGNYTTTEYDALGRVSKITDMRGGQAETPYFTTYTYDSLGRLIEESIPFQSKNGVIYNTIKKKYYDRNGNVILEKISCNIPGDDTVYTMTVYEYNNRNMLTMVTTFNDSSPENYTQYFYDAVGNKLRMYTGLSAPLEINGLDNVYPSSDPDYAVTKYRYDNFGNLIEKKSPSGMVEEFAYDLNGNMLQKIDRNGSVITMTYDGLGRLLDHLYI